MADKERSPNYPAIDLSTTIRFARQIYSKEGKSAVSMQALAQALGHEGLSGAARTKIATLRQFGLLERLAGDRYRLSRPGIELALHEPTDREFKIAARLAASTPTLFAELMAEYAEASENSVRLHLIKDRGFSDLGARKAARAFALTREAAGIGDGIEQDAGDDELSDELGDVPVSVARVTSPPTQHAVKVIGANAVIAPANAYSWLLAGGIRADLSFSGVVTVEALDMLVEYLNLMKRALPASTGGQNPEPEVVPQ